MKAFDESQVRRGGVANPGRFTNKTNSAPATVLSDEATTPAPKRGLAAFIQSKRDAFLKRGFVPATAGPSTAGTPRNRVGIDNWWRDAQVHGEVRADGKSHHQMPDDYTPSGLDGRSLSGNRRTYRRLYASDEIAIRMPSVTSIRRYSREIGRETFDVPITAEGPAGKPVSGHVRITETAPGRFTVSAINMPPNAQAKVAEAVNAVLESRRPTTALRDAAAGGGLLARADERRAAAGAQLTQTDNSSFVRGVGYNEARGEMVINLNGRHYAYEVPKGVFEYVASSHSVGKSYNAQIKGRYDSHAVEQCTRCARWSRAVERHACAGHRPPTGIAKPYNDRVRAVVMGAQPTTVDKS